MKSRSYSVIGEAISPCTGRRRSRPRGAYPEAWWAVCFCCCLVVVWLSSGGPTNAWGLLPPFGRRGYTTRRIGQFVGEAAVRTSSRAVERVWVGIMGDVWSWSWIRSSTFGSGCDAARLAFPCLPAAAPACIQTGLDWLEPSGCGGAVWGGNCLCEPYPCCHPCCSPPRALTEVSLYANHRSVGGICRLLGMQLQVSSPLSQEIPLGVALYFIVEH